MRFVTERNRCIRMVSQSALQHLDELIFIFR